jgi:hypothetical protein
MYPLGYGVSLLFHANEMRVGGRTVAWRSGGEGFQTPASLTSQIFTWLYELNGCYRQISWENL